MKKKLKKKVESDGSVYYVDEENRIQGIAENRFDGELVCTETYKDDFLHGKLETFLSGGGSEKEFFFYGKSVGIGEEGEKEFDELNKLDTIKERLEISKNKFPDDFD